MSSIYTGQFWRALGERVLSTALQAAIPALTAAGFGAINWGLAVSLAGAAAVLSLAKGVLAGLATGSPGIGNAEELTPSPAVVTTRVEGWAPPPA